MKALILCMMIMIPLLPLTAMAGDVYGNKVDESRDIEVFTVCKNGVLFIVAVSGRGVDIEQVYKSDRYDSRPNKPVTCKVSK